MAVQDEEIWEFEIKEIGLTFRITHDKVIEDQKRGVMCVGDSVKDEMKI